MIISCCINLRTTGGPFLFGSCYPLKLTIQSLKKSYLSDKMSKKGYLYFKKCININYYLLCNSGY